MKDWLYDEDINRTAIEYFKAVGIEGKHIKYDYNKGGIEDGAVLQFAKSVKKTLITANSKDFVSINNTEYRNTCGAWCLEEQDGEKQAHLLKKAIDATQLKTLNDRKNKKVIIRTDKVTVVDCTTNKIMEIKYKNESTSKSKKKIRIT